MAIDTFSPNRNYTLPATGNDVNTWGPLLNANFSSIDNNISAEYVINTTGGTVTLTAANASNLFINVLGALTSNVTIVFPGTIRTFFFAINNTTGAFTVMFKTANTGAAQILLQSGTGIFYSDGFNIIAMAETTAPLIPSGTVMGSFLQASAPTGWTQVNTFNDQVMRVVNNTGIGGATGGSWSISGFTDTPVALSIAQIPSHNHTYVAPSIMPGLFIAGGSGTQISNNFTQTTSSTGGGATHSHGPITNDATWRPAYVNALVASKN